MANTATFYEWRLVPARVAELLPYAFTVKLAYERAAVAVDLLSTSVATWAPSANQITVYGPTLPTDSARIKLAELLGKTPVMTTFAATTPDWDKEIIIKRGSVVPGLPAVWNTGTAMLGGPTPLSNGLMTGLLAGGLGYGAGALAEQLFPERYIQRGKLRRTLGMIGALGGLATGGVNAYSNAKAMRTSMLKGLVTRNDTPFEYPHEQLPEKAAMSYDDTGAYPGMPLYQPNVHVSQFNQAAWNDVQRGFANGFQTHTPPQYAAAATGLMSGIGASQRSPIIRPIDVIHGIASAGVGLATANIAGRALSAMAGLTPEGQNKLQDMGLWGGMMHAIIPPLFGAR